MDASTAAAMVPTTRIAMLARHPDSIMVYPVYPFLTRKFVISSLVLIVLIVFVIALVPPEYIAQLLTAIGTGLAALIGLVGFALIKTGKQRDEAYKESTIARLDEEQKQRQRDAEESKRERAVQAKQIEDMANQVTELNRVINDLRVTLANERGNAERERMLANQWRGELTELTKSVLAEGGFLKRPNDGR
jgi:hypothetical protein